MKQSGENGETLDRDNPVPSNYPNGYFKDQSCKVCGNRYTPTNPCHTACTEVCKLHARRTAYLKRNYGITMWDYDRMLKEQDYKCKICRTAGFVMDVHRHALNLVVDHCHATGKVRGLLCHNCNRGLGLFKEDHEILSRALEYLKV